MPESDPSAPPPAGDLTVVAIDGPAGSGKSTVGRALAARLGLDYLDTGAMYRGVTFAALRLGHDPADAEVIANLARNLELTVEEGKVIVDGVDATIEIRGPEVTRAVSAVAANPEVRSELVRRQREWARQRGGGVLEGRDIGTVVFPDAVLKVYLTASPEVRAERRAKEVTDLDYATVAADIARRDAADQGRADSPLAQAEGAVVVDTSHRAVEEIVDELVAMVEAARRGGGSREPRRAPESASAAELRFYAAVRAVLLAFARAWLRLSARGVEHVPAEGPFILAPVHRSNLDFLLVLICTKRRLRFLAKDSLWKGIWGRIFTALGGIPVARGTADREALRKCIEAIESGEPLVIFPEGTRQFGPEVHPLFDGPAYVQSKTGVPIVPVGIGGSEAAMPKGAKWIKPRKVRVVVGPPLPPIEAEGSKARRTAVRARTAELHDVIQELFDQAQVEAGTPNR